MAATIAVTCLLAVPAAQADTELPRGLASVVERGASHAPHERPCRSARKAVAYYRAAYNGWRAKMGAEAHQGPPTGGKPIARCPRIRYLAERWREKARAARIRYASWHDYHYAWWKWLPDKWARIGACETGYGRRPGDWRWNSGTYQGAFGFAVSSWDAFVRYADPRARPYPSEAYLATPRQQYEVALAIWRRYGFSGWGCRGA